MTSRLTELLGVELPLVEAPMAGSVGAPLAIAVAQAGGLGSLPCAVLAADAIRADVAAFRAATDTPVNLNFFCHAVPPEDPDRMAAWMSTLAPFSQELGADPGGPAGAGRPPFDATRCELVEELRPEIVSFHFGLPDTPLVDRVRATGATIMSSATTVAEARWLADRGCDVIIAQGAEAGGHRGMFLSSSIATQIGTIALVPLVVDAVSVPVVAAGGISDARGIAAAFALGADGVQIGTAFLLCPEAATTPLHRRALQAGGDTALTNVFTGRPARGLVNRAVAELGPMADLAPPFPLATGPMAGLRAAAEKAGSSAFSPLWSGQAGPLARAVPAGDLIRSWLPALRA